MKRIGGRDHAETEMESEYHDAGVKTSLLCMTNSKELEK